MLQGYDEQSRLLAENQQIQKQRISKNRILLLSSLNLITLLSAIAALTYFKWLSITITTSEAYHSSPTMTESLLSYEPVETLWVNLLYVSEDSSDYISFRTAQEDFCL